MQLDSPADAVPLHDSMLPEGASAGEVVGPLGTNLVDLNFGYVVLYQEHRADGKTKNAPPPAWSPLRVFDKTAARRTCTSHRKSAAESFRRCMAWISLRLPMVGS